MTFNAPVLLTADEAPNGIILADVNGDGRMDIAAVNLVGDSVTVLVNQGHGSFAPELLYGAGGGPVVVRSGDLNRDGRTDLVVINQYSSDMNCYCTLHGRGDCQLSGSVAHRMAATNIGRNGSRPMRGGLTSSPILVVDRRVGPNGRVKPERIIAWHRAGFCLYWPGDPGCRVAD